MGINMLVALFQQWIIPSVRNSLEPFSVSDAPRRCSRDSDFFAIFCSLSLIHYFDSIAIGEAQHGLLVPSMLHHT